MLLVWEYHKDSLAYALSKRELFYLNNEHPIEEAYHLSIFFKPKVGSAMQVKRPMTSIF